MDSQINHLKIKCPVCNRHLDEIKTNDRLEILRKCKSCKNNISTLIENGEVVYNKINTKANAVDILNIRTSGPFGANHKK